MANTAAVMTGIDQIEIREVADPTPEPGQVIVRMEAVGVCGSDTAYFRRGRIGDWIVTGDFILGHEAAGEVVQVGEGVTSVAPGDRVAIEPGTPCRDCEQCLRGRYHLCPDLIFLATPPHQGALVQRLAIDARNLHRLPESLSYEQGALVEPLSVGLWACQRAALRPGERVLVTGAGPVGLLAAEAARALGAGSVTVTDISSFRLEVAQQHGFTTMTDLTTATRDFDVLLECTGADGVLAQAARLLGPAGRAAVIGLAKGDSALPLPELSPMEITIALVHRYQHTWPTAIELIASGRIKLDGLQTHSFSLDETAEALTCSAREPNSLKAVIYPQRRS